MINFGDWQGFLNTKTQNCKNLSNFQNNRKLSVLVRDVKTSDIIGSCSWIKQYFKNVKESQKISQKSNDKAENFRKLGNEKFRWKKYEEALLQYDQGILYSECDSMEFAYCCANRSAVLYHFGLYEACLSDIEVALACGYPDNLQCKLYIRRSQCYIELTDVDEAKAAIEMALKLLPLVEDKKQYSTEKDIKALQRTISNMTSNSSLSKTNVAVPPSPSHGCNDTVVQASVALELKYTEDQGRHLVARQDIAAGDVLIVERPYAAVLLPPHYGTNCHHCFASMTVYYPCKKCVEVQYCSISCRDTSWSVYHYIECPYLDVLHSIGIAHLSLRVILTAGLKQLLEFRSEYLSTSKSSPDQVQQGDVMKIPGLTKDRKYERNYLAVYELMPHSNNMVPEDLYQYTLTATLLLYVLEDAGYFSELYEEGDRNIPSSENVLASVKNEQLKGKAEKMFENLSLESDDSTFESMKWDIGGLLLRHICQLVCNAHAISALQTSQTAACEAMDDQTQERVATAIYSTTSLLNHSCQPTIMNSFIKDVLVVRAVCEVKAGQQIYNCYGPSVNRMTYQERQISLKSQYFFTCQCLACLQCGETEQLYMAFRCSSCNGPLLKPTSIKPSYCVECKLSHDTADMLRSCKEAMTLFYIGVRSMDEGRYKESCDVLKKVLVQQEMLLYKHNTDLARTHNALAKCYCCSGDYAKAVPHMQKSLESTRIIYGNNSIELARELDNFGSVLVHTKNKTLAVSVIEEAINLFRINCGDGSENIVELKKLLWIAHNALDSS